MSKNSTKIIGALLVLLAAPAASYAKNGGRSRHGKHTDQADFPGARQSRWNEQCNCRSKRHRQHFKDGSAAATAHNRPDNSAVQVIHGSDSAASQGKPRPGRGLLHSVVRGHGVRSTAAADVSDGSINLFFFRGRFEHGVLEAKETSAAVG